MNALVQNEAIAAGAAMAAEHQGRQYLTFMLGGEIFAIGILAIKEIIEYDCLTVVPMMPECIRGVINLRGAVVPVMDLSTRFGRASTNVTKRTCIVIVEIESAGERHDVGAIVDAVNEVMEIPASAIEPPPAFGAKVRTDFIHGMGNVDGKFVVILDADKLLSCEDLEAVTIAGAVAHQEQPVADALAA